MLWRPGLGLNGAVTDGVLSLGEAGLRAGDRGPRDLPLAVDLDWLAALAGLTLVPDRRDDGTNVACVPTDVGLHVRLRARILPPPRRRGAPARARRCGSCASRRLGWDVDVPDDLSHPVAPGGAPVAANEPGQPRLSPRPGPLTTNLPMPASALAIGAHPDDVEFGCGGTLAKWAAAGCVVHHLVLHRRLEGHVGPERRHRRARRHSARTSSARRPRRSAPPATVVFLGDVDGELDERRWRERGEVARVIRLLRPEVVLGHDPWKRYRLHPDHRHAGLLACDGIVAARDPHFFPEHGLAHAPASAPCCCGRPTRPTTPRTSPRSSTAKLAALEAHASQFESTMKATDEHQLEAFRRRIRGRLAEHGAPHRQSPPPSCSAASTTCSRTAPDRSPHLRQRRAELARRRPPPGGPAKAWAMPIHSVGRGPLITSCGVGGVAALGDDEAEVERRHPRPSVGRRQVPTSTSRRRARERTRTSAAGRSSPRLA